MLRPRKYSQEFKTQAVELVRIGKSVTEVAEELGIGAGMLYRWISRSRQSEQADGKDQNEEETGVKNLRRLQKENARLRLENDILKKAAVILGNNQAFCSGK